MYIYNIEQFICIIFVLVYQILIIFVMPKIY
nr:MAG TPA: hypothetical protein [Caudoviricetes sp.]